MGKYKVKVYPNAAGYGGGGSFPSSPCPIKEFVADGYTPYDDYCTFATKEGRVCVINMGIIIEEEKEDG